MTTTIRSVCSSSSARSAVPGWFVLSAALAFLPIAAVAASAAAQTSGHSAPDTLAERVRACTACHGKEGRASNQGYLPRIAGKPAGYLYNQLVGFREGRRHYPLMTGLLENLNDDYLREIAGHFAGLDLPYPPPQVSGANPAVVTSTAICSVANPPATRCGRLGPPLAWRNAGKTVPSTTR